MNNKIAFFTMDVESFYDTSCIKDKQPYEKNYSCLDGLNEYLSLLNKEDIKATLFLNVETLNETKNDLLLAKNCGHEIALHSLKHYPLSTISENEFDKQLKLAKDEILNELGVSVLGYRAPCFDINDKFLNVVKDNGFLYDASVLYKETVNLSEFEQINRCVYSKDNFYEFTPTLTKFLGKNISLSGGAYLRLMPWFFAKILLKKHLKKSNGYIFYLHPFEVSKTKLPKFKNLTFLEKIFITRGRKTYLKKIKFIIKYLKKQGYEFSTMSKFINN